MYVTTPTTARTPEPASPTLPLTSKSPAAYPFPAVVTVIPETAPLETVTVATAPAPIPLRVVNGTPVCVPCSNFLVVCVIERVFCLEKATIGCSFLILPKAKSWLYNTTEADFPVTNFALFNLNFKSSC